MSIFERLLNIYCWIRIFLSPFSIGLVVGYVAWHNIDGFYGELAMALIVAGGAIVGIKFAENVRKKTGDAYNSGEIDFKYYMKAEDENEAESSTLSKTHVNKDMP